MTYIELSHLFQTDMPGFRMDHPDTGEAIEYTAKIYPFLTHDQTKQYFVDEDVIDYLVDNQVRLVGVDTINIDSTDNKHRTAHSKLLANDILIVENLTNLSALRGNPFMFYAIPIRAKAAAFPVRAFASLK